MSRRARVTFDYQATENDELDLIVGQIIEDITNEDEGWCKGYLDGKTGLFPDNFVEFISGEAATHSIPSKAVSLPGKKAKVTFEYEASNEDELSLKTGDVVEVIEEVEDGWWEGKIGGRTGVFPSNFVELIKEDEAPPIHSPKEEAKESALDEEEGNKRVSIIGQARKMGGGMGFGNIINAGILSGTKLKRVDGKPKKEPEHETKPPPDLLNSLGSPMKKVPGGSMKRKAPPVPPPGAPAPAAAAPPPVPPTTAPAPAKKVEKAKVLFDYEKQNNDELDLVVGNIVTVLNKEVYETEGWWEGELNGKTGLFPDNFVELLPEEEEVKDQHVKQLQKKVPLPASPGQRATPPLPAEENQRTSEGNIKEIMKKASDHEPPKLPGLKPNAKPNIDSSKPNILHKKPVPPKPATKPSLPSKKPVPKPPTDTKKDIQPKPIVREQGNFFKTKKTSDEDTHDNSKARTNEECNLDVVTPHEPLKQLTANRAGKQQAKRPPSTTRQSEGSLMDTVQPEEIDEEETSKPIQIEPKEPAWKREATKAREARKVKEETAPSPVPAVKEKKIPPPVLQKPDEIIEKRKSWLKDEPTTKKPEPKPVSTVDVSGLRQEVTELRALVINMEKKMAAMERKHEEKVKSLEKRLEKDIEQLTSDFDEERTNHARLKIEVDRLKKKSRRDSGPIDGDDSSHA